MGKLIVYVDRWDDDGCFVDEVELPSKMEVCPRCHGRGVHDCWEGGMTAEEMWEQGDDFIDDYRAGMYDRVCSVCDGRNVVEVVDEDRCTPELLAAWWDQLAEEDADRHTRWAESGYPR
jgi:RecJ-like exonuclease